MKKMKLKLMLFTICISAMFVIGCSNNQDGDKDTSINNSILDIVQDKYYINLPKEKEDGSTILGMICYFNDERVELSFLPIDDFNNDEFKYVSTEIGEDFVKYNIEEDFITYTAEDGSEAQRPEGYFKITKDENNNLTLESPWLSTSNFNLIDKEECTKIINDKFSLIKVEDFIEEFNQKFNLKIEALVDVSNNDSMNSNLDIETAEFTKEKAMEYLIEYQGEPFKDKSTQCSKKYLFYDTNLRYEGERVYYRILEQEVFPAHINEIAWNVYSDGTINNDAVTSEELQFIIDNDSIN